MQVLTSPNWSDYELIDSGNGQRLERFGKYTLVRPDPQCIWKQKKPQNLWKNANAVFKRTSEDKGVWTYNTKLPDKWLLTSHELSFWIKLTAFKHTGVFPEQAVQWDYIRDVIARRVNDLPAGKHGEAISHHVPTGSPRSARDDVNILNLFAYTGIASLFAAQAGATVTHVDASKPAVTWARENQKLSKLDNSPIRWIVDDAVMFCKREIKRGVRYDGIIMDPPIYGHGPGGETWNFHKDFPLLLDMCRKLLSDTPLFVIVNAYAISASSLMLQNMLHDYCGDLGGAIDCGELALKDDSQRLLSTGIFGIWKNE